MVLGCESVGASQPYEIFVPPDLADRGTRCSGAGAASSLNVAFEARSLALLISQGRYTYKLEAITYFLAQKTAYGELPGHIRRNVARHLQRISYRRKASKQFPAQRN